MTWPTADSCTHQNYVHAAGMASHRTMALEPSPYQNLLHPLHWALRVTKAEKLLVLHAINVSLITTAATWHMTPGANQMPHEMPHKMPQSDSNYRENSRINVLTTSTQRLEFSWLRLARATFELHFPFHSHFHSPYISQCIAHDKSADNYALMSTP